ncbi:flagellar basal body P-ring protein FlgI [Thermodesulfovibrionales bacterium]|nr:flagellar basal body P-ring protein FlgI [Thermodesulfovibrionales bacterium]
MAMRREDAIMKTIRYLILILLVLSVTTDAMAERIKDIATFSGVRGNDLVGFGVVVGLHGTGDRGGTFTTQAVANMLTRMGISVAPEDIEGQIRNAAAVIVTARLPTMIKPGSKLDVQVSSIGDARSLQGGVLLTTPLKGPDNVVYAVAQGPVSIGGFVGGAPGAHVVKNHPNVGRIPNGAIVEREVPVHLNAKNRLNLLLKMQDITTAMRIADSINERLVGNFARPESPSVVSVIVPDQFRGRVVELMAEIELLRVDVDRVVDGKFFL